MNEQVMLWNEDCIVGAGRHLPDGSVDLIITDPPYGIGGDHLHRHYNRKENFVADGYIEIPDDEYGAFCMAWIREAERVLRPGGSIYIVSGYTNLFHILAALRETTLREINHIIWKYNFGVWTSRKYISSHYHILYYSKPGGERTFNLECRFGTGEKNTEGRSLNYQDREDVWIISREYKPGQVKNKNELPVALLSRMILYSSNPGDLVCDFFLGGCSTARVAIGLNRRICGFERSKEIFGIREPEISALSPGFLLKTIRVPEKLLGPATRHRWTEPELVIIRNRHTELSGQGRTKKEIIAHLMDEFHAGRFAIMGAMKKAGI